MKITPISRQIVDYVVEVDGETFPADALLALLDECERGVTARAAKDARARMKLETLGVLHRWGSFNWIMNIPGPNFAHFQADLRAALAAASVERAA